MIFYKLFFRVTVIGKENLPKERVAFIVMPNHLSNVDPPLVSYALKIPIAFMAKKELYTVPIIKHLIYILGAFSVDRDKVEISTVKAVRSILSMSWAVGIFLEGTRSKIPGTLGKPNSGPSYFSNLCNVPILPVGVIGSHKLFGKVTVKVGKLFHPNSDIEQGKYECLQKLSELTGYRIPESFTV